MSVERLPEPNPSTGCPLDHDTLETKYLIGDDGWVLARCAFCNLQVEPRMADREDPKYPGPAWGKGRGEPVARLLDHLVAWAGWVDSPFNPNGGR